MISSKFLATTALAAAVISTIGLAYAQTATPAPDPVRVESNSGTTAPTTPMTGKPSTMGTSTTAPTPAMPMGSTPATEPATSTTMPAATTRDPSTAMPSGNMNNSSSDMSSNPSMARKERVARADRN